MENVSFRYPGAETDTLKNINLTLHPGENLAVVGLNGAGKTTLIKIICGFLDPTKGQVKLNGTDIRNYNRKDYYKLFSAVFQDFSLLAGTIAENVAQTENFDLKQVKNCIKKAGLLPKIEALPDKYQTFLNREVYKNAIMFSGGETQRLMLARALYKDAPFIILDEPTAALDSIAEADIYQKYDEMTKGKSSVYISHRLASTRFCSRILMLEQGEIQEEGTHEELLRQSGKYAALYEVQSKYYREGDGENEDFQLTKQGIATEGLIFCKVLYIAGDDTAPIQSKEIVIPFEYLVEIPEVAETDRCEIRGVLEQIGGYVVDSNELEIRAVAGIYVTGFSPQTMYMIDEVEEIPYSEEEISRIPSITGYIVKSGDTLWNIAKHYGTTIEKMKQYNENLTEPLETGQKLFLLKEMESLIGE